MTNQSSSFQADDGKWHFEAWLQSLSLPPTFAPLIRKSLMTTSDAKSKQYTSTAADTPSGNNVDDFKLITRFLSSTATMESKGQNKNNVMDIKCNMMMGNCESNEEDLMDILRARMTRYKDEIFAIVLQELMKGMEIFRESGSGFKEEKKKEEIGSSPHQDDQASITKNEPSKFNGTPGGVLRFEGLETFYGGLEGIIGTPNSNVTKAIRDEHTKRHNANIQFTPNNYNVTTTSIDEWKKVDPDNIAEMEPFYMEMEQLNDRLVKDHHPPLTKIEVSALRCYTGPMYTVYNSIVRNIRGGSLNDLKGLVKLVGDSHAEELVKEIELEEPQDQAGVDHETAATSNIIITNQHRSKILQHCNLYTTTIHAINSGIIKLSKLTEARKVYRGISGRTLPESFLEPNKFNVRGGVELGFMSTTTERNVALEYANKDNNSAGIVFEIQQGMVNRGANLKWLSQHEEEDEVLFSPLTGIEIHRGRVEGSLIILEVGLSVNLTSLTIEQVIGKRLKLLEQMRDDIIVEMKTSSYNKTSSALSTSSEHSSADGQLGTDSTLAVANASASATVQEKKLLALTLFENVLKIQNVLGEDPDHYNDDTNFKTSVNTILDHQKAIEKVSAENSEVLYFYNECSEYLSVKDYDEENYNDDRENDIKAMSKEKELFWKVIEELINVGADVNGADKDGRTPLHRASQDGHLTIVEKLINVGADVNCADKYGWTPLHLADVNCADKYGWTPLHLASESGHLTVAEKLINVGADVNCADKDGWTPLYWASRNGHLTIVEKLINVGADVNCADKYGDTPLHGASRNGHLAVVEKLINVGADVNCADEDGWTPLHLASESGHLTVAEKLINVGADVNCANEYGYTPLHVASRNGRLTVVEKLINVGADINAADKYGETPIDIATRFGETEVVEYLKSQLANQTKNE